TNFVSQAMHAGGWKLKGGWDPNDLNNWHYDLTGPARWSKTWSVPAISQNSRHRHNVPLYLWIKMAFSDSPDDHDDLPDHYRAVIYSVRTKTSFNS
ncbi:hypothetical protein AB0M20_45130, partial [Actinoplanes sp. NPDC051633]|uniref:hypothetical protein n=1 Tax=Actinoplanes sp. NPDC051633 TaxID=3155670 RepID=UPI003434F29C